MVLRSKSKEIQEFALNSAVDSPLGIARSIAEKFGISRQAANVHLRRMVDDGLLSATGRTLDRGYSLPTLRRESLKIPIDKSVQEDLVWAQLSGRFAEPTAAPPLSPGVRGIAFYGFTELVNNAVDHSAGNILTIDIAMTARSITLTVVDDGVGIFKKIATECHLDNQRHAILELTKGKLTTDRDRHSGEGIFFTSRACDVFVLGAGTLGLICVNGKDWLIEVEEHARVGTMARMTIRLDTKRTMEQVFRKYAVDEEPTFSRTTVPVNLAPLGDENLISRSQAKRLLARVDRFQEVMLDFKGVQEVGQAFADEVFRVYARQHPDVKIIAIRANARVQRMIDRAIIARDGKLPEGPE